MDKYEIHPIGYISNSINTRKEMVPTGLNSSITIEEDYLPAIKFLEENSHIIVLSFFHEAKRDVLQVCPKKFGLTYPIEKGVFSTRSPDRPNPVACTITKLFKIEGSTLHVERLDGINGTPVIDIKPYSYGSDCIFNTQSLNIKTNFQNSSDERILEYLRFGAHNYINLLDDSFEEGINLMLKAIKTIGKMPDRFIIDSIETNASGNALDILYYYTKITPGEKRFIENNENNSKKLFANIKLKDGTLIQIN